MKIIFMGWNEGLQKVSLTKLQVDILGLSLKQAKMNVDNLLDDIKVSIEVHDESIAINFCDQASKIGVHCAISP